MNGGGSGSSLRFGILGVDNKNLKVKDFMVMIKIFINWYGGKVLSKMLVDYFNYYCLNKK